MAAKVTLKDIAREVGLSPTAVSLVLNDRPCKISEESRRRIKEVARRKRYIPNQIARSLVTQHSQTVGLIVPNIESRFFSSHSLTALFSILFTGSSVIPVYKSALLPCDETRMITEHFPPVFGFESCVLYLKRMAILCITVISNANIIINLPKNLPFFGKTW